MSGVDGVDAPDGIDVPKWPRPNTDAGGELGSGLTVRRPVRPIVGIRGEPLAEFEGALVPIGAPRRGWVVIVNSNASPGRRRFTIAHEAGHYLLHRHLLSEGVHCGEDVVTRRAGRGIEKEADTFAATLLMPFHDLRKRIDARAKPTLDDLSICAAHYRVSLTAITLRWLEYTERRSMLVMSVDGFVLWARSSEPALRSGRFIRTSGAPYELPTPSSAGRFDFSAEARAGIRHRAGVWFDEEVEELTFYAGSHGQVFTVLHMGAARPRWSEAEEESVPDTVDKFEVFR